jgi:hypothetical protein
MDLVVKSVCSKRDLRRFIYLPARIHKKHPNWIPPLYSDEWEFFSAKKNKSFEYCDVIYATGLQWEVKWWAGSWGSSTTNTMKLHREKHAVSISWRPGTIVK